MAIEFGPSTEASIDDPHGLDALMSSLDELRERSAYLASREVEIPEVLYHATPRRNFVGIREEGLEPRPLYFSDDEVVSLSDDPHFALSVVSETQKTPVEQLKLLAVDTAWLRTRDVANYLRKEDTDNANPFESAAIHEVHYSDDIDPRALSVQEFQYDRQTQSITLFDSKPLAGDPHRK